MPEMHGMEATARIREKEKLAGGHQPIVALTAHAMKGDQELCLAGGMDGYLTKPICAQELDQILEQFAGRGAAIVKGRWRACGWMDGGYWGGGVGGRAVVLAALARIFHRPVSR
jgi:DNA-binding NarL/FixJ family response regulator